MPRSWDDGLSPRERANLVRRLRRIWTQDLLRDELADEMSSCIRCWRKPGTSFECRGCGGNPEIAKTCGCGGSGRPQKCLICNGTGIMPGWSLDAVLALAAELGLSEQDRGGNSAYLPTEEQIRLAKAKLKMRWTPTQIEASLRGTLNSGGDNGDGGPAGEDDS